MKERGEEDEVYYIMEHHKLDRIDYGERQLLGFQSFSLSHPSDNSFAFLQLSDHSKCHCMSAVVACLIETGETSSSCLNCVLRDLDLDEQAVYWVSIGRNEAVALGN